MLDQLFEAIIEKMEDRVRKTVQQELSAWKQQEENDRSYGVMDLKVYTTLQKAAKDLGISPKTLSSYKSNFEYREVFGQIYIVRESLLDFIESTKPKIEIKKIMRTRHQRSAA